MFDGLRRHIGVWRMAWRAERRRPRRRRRSEERGFLPAALEILETPVSPIGRATMGLISLFVVLALAWAYFGQTDIVATAYGKIIPHSRSKIVQSAEMGVVREIFIQDGSRVHKGDLLISLDPTQSDADLERITREHLAARIDVARLRTLAQGDEPLRGFDPPSDATAAMVQAQENLIESTLREYKARLDVQRKELTRQRAEYEVVQTSIKRLKQEGPLVREQVRIRQYLADKGLSSKLLLLDLKQRLVANENDVLTQEARLREVLAAIETTERKIVQIEQAFNKQILTDLAEAEIRAAALEQELRKVRQRYGLQDLTAPVDGVVQQLAVHSSGAVVRPAQPLMVIVPSSERLEVEVKLLNKDIGFVSVGQAVEIKLETFPYTRYGVIEGTLKDVSSDAVNDEKLGFVYPARVSLAKDTMTVGEKEVSLSPGMAATVEIKTGKRRVIEFVLSPLLRYASESLRER